MSSLAKISNLPEMTEAEFIAFQQAQMGVTVNDVLAEDEKRDQKTKKSYANDLTSMIKAKPFVEQGGCVLLLPQGSDVHYKAFSTALRTRNANITAEPFQRLFQLWYKNKPVGVFLDSPETSRFKERLNVLWKKYPHLIYKKNAQAFYGATQEVGGETVETTAPFRWAVMEVAYGIVLQRHSDRLFTASKIDPATDETISFKEPDLTVGSWSYGTAENKTEVLSGWFNIKPSLYKTLKTDNGSSGWLGDTPTALRNNEKTKFTGDTGLFYGNFPVKSTYFSRFSHPVYGAAFSIGYSGEIGSRDIKYTIKNVPLAKRLLTYTKDRVFVETPLGKEVAEYILTVVPSEFREEAVNAYKNGELDLKGLMLNPKYLPTFESTGFIESLVTSDEARDEIYELILAIAEGRDVETVIAAEQTYTPVKTSPTTDVNTENVDYTEVEDDDLPY